MSATGPGWSCAVIALTVTCTRSDSLAPGDTYPPIIIGVDVAPGAQANLLNAATVSGGGDGDTTNNTGEDQIGTVPQADLAVQKDVLPTRIRAGDNARTVDEPEFHGQREMALRQEAWITHRAALARELSDDQWRAVRQAYDALAMPPGPGRAEDFVNKRYASAMKALEPLMSSDRRYWWQRAWRGIHRRR